MNEEMNMVLLRKDFLEAVRTIGTVSGATLRKLLNWDPETFSKVKNELKSEERITVGRGRGGVISLPHATTAQHEVDPPSSEQAHYEVG